MTMDHGLPDDHSVRVALALAVRAPSVHNTQPWRWRIADRSVHLYLDPPRALPPPDLDQRDLVLSCGAALHHLRVAFAALGWSAVVRRLPNPAQPNHLASIEPVRHRRTPNEIELSAAITRRRTDRRLFTERPVPPGYLGLVTERAAILGATVRQVTDRSRDYVVEAMRAAAEQHAGEPEYRFEPPEWRDGPATAAVPAHECDFAELLVVGTSADDLLSRLCAGEALSAVLLTATNVGLATCLLTEPLETPTLRDRVRAGVLNNYGYPQAVIRVGWAPTSDGQLPRTPRRAVEDVLAPSTVGVAEATAC